MNPNVTLIFSPFLIFNRSEAFGKYGGPPLVFSAQCDLPKLEKRVGLWLSEMVEHFSLSQDNLIDCFFVPVEQMTVFAKSVEVTNGSFPHWAKFLKKYSFGQSVPPSLS